MITQKIDEVDRKIKEETEKAYKTVDAARREAKGYANQAANEGEETLDDIKTSMDRLWSRAKKMGGQAEAKLAAYSKDGLESVQNYAKKRPVQVAAVALAIGIVVGGLLFSSSSES